MHTWYYNNSNTLMKYIFVCKCIP